MAALDAAQARVKAAEKKAASIVEAARIELGRVIRAERGKGVRQADIARHLGVERETIRRYQKAADIADGLKESTDA